uniref:DH domain-containing protein n=1 Tax=Globodera rostochiensis TaxID=31243 RepID=A0A914HWP5_GLORO
MKRQLKMLSSFRSSKRRQPKEEAETMELDMEENHCRRTYQQHMQHFVPQQHRQLSLDKQSPRPSHQCPPAPPVRAEDVVHGLCCSSSPSSSKCLCAASTSGLSHSQSAIASSGKFCGALAVALDNDGPHDGLGEETIPVKVAYVLEELLSTEKSYVCELEEIVKHYMQPFEVLDLSGNSQIPSGLRGQADILFGNIRELLDFHRCLLLPALQHSSNSVHGVSFVLNAQRHRLLALYRTYCRNKPISEVLRAENSADQLKFFMECQRRAGHLLPLSAYLLKPIQRITKYQLLLKELIRRCSDADQSQSVQSALAAMLDILAQIDADMEHLHILGYPGDLRLLGALRLRTECEVYIVKRAKSTLSGGSSGGATNRRSGAKGKHQKRHLFLFDGGVLFCKKRVQSVHISGEYYEHKLCIPMHSLAFSDFSSHSDELFDIWDVRDSVSYAVKTAEDRGRTKWLQRLTIVHQQKMAESAQEGIPMEPHPPWHNKMNSSSKTSRPKSWTTTSSSEDGGGMANSGVMSSRSSTASSYSTTFEEKCAQGEMVEMSVSCGHPSELVPNSTDVQVRLHSQPPKNAEEKSKRTTDGGG